MNCHRLPSQYTNDPMSSMRRLVVIGLAFIAASTAKGQEADPGEFWLRSNAFEAWEWDIDHDGDGFTSREEYQVGSDPRDFFSIPIPIRVRAEIDPGTGDFLMSWPTVLGAAYQIEDSGDLTGFSQLGDPVAGLTDPITADLGQPAGRGFFRVSFTGPLDCDGDGLSDREEVILGTNPCDPDSDGDGIGDGEEVNEHKTDPTVPGEPGAIICGQVFFDPDGDGDLADGDPLESAVVYLDSDYDGELDPEERWVTTDELGGYEFDFVQPGLYHVRQQLSPPNVQTVPQEGLPPTYDMLPDEVADYVHAEDAVGNFDEPYGEIASEWPGNWPDLETTGTNAEPAPLDLALKPIGIRNVVPTVGTYFGSEFLSLPLGASILLRFDEPIVDGPGADFLIHSITNQASATDTVAVRGGRTPGDLQALGTAAEREATIPVDLADVEVEGPIHYLELTSQGNGGAWKGFELTGIEVRNLAAPDPGASVIQVVGEEVFDDRDFGRYFRDLPPEVILQVADNNRSTPQIRAGESAQVCLNAFDDFGVESVSLLVDGAPVALDADNKAILPLPDPGLVRLTAIVTDSGGQQAETESLAYVFNADGSFPYDPGRTGPGTTTSSNAPAVRILSPAAGVVSDADLPVIADIAGTPTPTSWTVEYAPIDLVDPYDNAADDPDYIELASGTGAVFSDEVATLPLSTLPDGIYFLRVCASNSPFEQSCQGQVFAKNVPETDLRPQIVIDSPAPGTDVTMSIDITGTITSVQPLREWYAEFAPADLIDVNDIGADNPAWKRFAEGTSPIDASSLIANFDSTVIKNNGYLVRIVAWNDIGLGRVEPLALDVCAEAKLGRNRLEFTDFSLDMVGFPLEFKRIYDSLQADEDGELGYGWSLELQDADIRETVPDTGTGSLFGVTPFRDGTRVYITAPTGERLGFTFRPELGVGSLAGGVYRAAFEPDPGNYHTLEVPEGDQPFLTLNPDGTVSLFFFGLPWNPEKYILTTPGPDVRRYTYHEDQGFLQAEDLNGNTITLTDDGIAHSAGLDLRFERDGQGRITKVINPADEEWAYAYDADGNLASVTDRDNNTTTYAYLADPAHYLASITDPIGRIPVRYEYDADGRLDAVIDEDGNRAEIAWDPGAFTGEITNLRGFTTKLVYDARGNVTREEDHEGNVTLYEYGDPDNPDRETRITDAKLNVTRYQYSESGMVTRFLPPLAAGSLNQEVTTYDEFGNVLTFRGIGENDSFPDTYTYDEQGNLTGSFPLRGTRFRQENNAAGQPQRIWLPDDGYEQRLSYEEDGSPAGLEDSCGLRETYTAGTNGIDFSRETTNSEVFALERKSNTEIQQVDPERNVVRFVDNKDGSFTITNREVEMVTLEVDSQGRVTGTILPNGGTIAVGYDAMGNRESVEDPNGNVTRMTYDFADRSTGFIDPALQVHSVSYDAVGNVEEIVDRNGKRRSFVYNADRKITDEFWYDAGGAVVRSITFTYDTNGNLRQVTDTEGAKVHTHKMDRADRPNSVRVQYSGQAEQTLNYKWARDEGRGDAPSEVLLAAGLDLRGYRASYHGGLLARLEMFHPDTTVDGDSVNLIRRADGALTQVDRFRSLLGGGRTPVFRTRYTYDSLGRVASIRHEQEDGSLIHPDSELVYGRDKESRITSIKTPTQTSTYGYDSMGQLVSADHSNPAYEDEFYTYDLGGNRTSSHLQPATATIGTANRVTAAGSFTYEYDIAGNMIRRTNTATGEETNFAYDHRNRMVLATVHPVSGSPAATTIELDYDYQDRLIMRGIDGVKTWILYDRQMPFAEFADGEDRPKTMFFYSPDQLDDFHLVWRRGIGEQWLATDNIGSVRGIVDASGNTRSWVSYDSFGSLQPGASAANGERLRYAGRFELPELSLYENRRRYLDPGLGRFTQEDPILLLVDYNSYRYSLNRPSEFRDPLGTQPAAEYNGITAITSRLSQYPSVRFLCTVLVAIDTGVPATNVVGLLLGALGVPAPFTYAPELLEQYCRVLLLF